MYCSVTSKFEITCTEFWWKCAIYAHSVYEYLRKTPSNTNIMETSDTCRRLPAGLQLLSDLKARGTKELRGRTLSFREHSLRDAGGGHAARRKREARLRHAASLPLALALALARRRRRCEELLAHAVEALGRPLLPDVRLEERGVAVEEGG